MPQSLFVEPSQQIFDSSTDREERANVQHPVAADRLQRTVGCSNEDRKITTNVSSYLFRLTPGEEPLQMHVSTSDTCSASDSYLNHVEYYPLMPCHLKE
jgi:hypothetical protein